MLAAENGALPGGKVGGMGDVVRDLPPALVALGCRVRVITPAYGRFSTLTGARRRGALAVPFAGGVERVERYVLPATASGVELEVLEHAQLWPQGPGRIYCNDPPERPFFTDASKFALFSAAAASLVAADAVKPDVVHLHDWHLGLYLALRELDPRYAALKPIRTVLTVHNLALQGTRPLRATESSLERWFPDLAAEPGPLADPHDPQCVNPLAAGIRLADGVNTVSPTYAAEILEPSRPEAGMRGGEGLEALLRESARAGRLLGILNGCDYSEPRPRKPGWKKLVETMQHELSLWIARASAVPGAHYLADRRLGQIGPRPPGVLLTSVGRAVDQKMRLLREPVGDHDSALDALLELLDEHDGRLVVLGSGDEDYETFLAQAAARHSSFVFLRGFSDELSALLYAQGDLFLMPSSFEPCGISQMLAMRAGQPCVVHAVGGLKDTVDSSCGFPFEGATQAEQARRFVDTVERALELRASDRGAWDRIRRAAAARRFEWAASAERYLAELYGPRKV